MLGGLVIFRLRHRAAHCASVCYPLSNGIVQIGKGLSLGPAVSHATPQIGSNSEKAAAVLFREGNNLDAVVICGSHGDTKRV